MSSENRSCGKRALQATFALAFVVGFILTAWLLVYDLTASATVAAVLTLSMGLFCFLPTLDSFTAFGLSAQFRKRIDEAEELLALIRGQATSTSRVVVNTVAWQNRMGSMTNEEKRDLMDDIVAALRKLEVPEAEIVSLREPFVRFACFDAARIYFSRYEWIAANANSAIDSALAMARSNETSREEVEALQRRKDALRVQPAENLHLKSAADIESLVMEEQEALVRRDSADFDEDVKAELEKLRADAETAIVECRAAGNFTPFALRYLRERRRP